MTVALFLRADGLVGAKFTIVESTSCTLGINRDKLEKIFDEIENKTANELFTLIKNAKFKESFLLVHITVLFRQDSTWVFL